MTDKELLELAAKAAGMKDGSWWDGWNDDGRGTGEYWNPLTDDGDALRLAVKLGLLVDVRYGNRDETWAVDVGYWPKGMEGKPYRSERVFSEDKYAATRRAIVRAAAEIGKEMK